MAKVLLVTDYSGVYHMTPVGNLGYYKRMNLQNKKQQYGFEQMDESEALKTIEEHKGRNPKFVKPADSLKIITEKDQKIKDLEAQLAALQNANQHSTPPNTNEDAAKKLTAVEVIEQIKAATTAAEVKTIAEGDTRATVIAAAAAKFEELKK